MVGLSSFASACCGSVCCCTGVPLLFLQCFLNGPSLAAYVYSWRDQAQCERETRRTRRVAKRPRDELVGVVDIGLIRAWRHRILGKRVPDQLVSHILSFLRESPPPLIGVSPKGAAVGLQTVVAGSSELSCLAFDVGGEPILVGAPSGERYVLTWDCRHGVGTSPSPMPLVGLSAAVSRLCLDVAADRIAAGQVDGTVHIWEFARGILLSTCSYHIWESTYWTSTGHAQEICCLLSAGVLSSGVSGSSVASADCNGVVCLWREDGNCLSCLKTSTYTANFDIPSDEFSDLVVSPGLLVCAMSHAIVGFSVPCNEVAFRLFVGFTSAASVACPSCILTIAKIPHLDDDGFSLVAVMNDGAMLAYDVSLGRSESFAEPMELLAAPRRCSGNVPVAGAGGEGKLCWIAGDESDSCVVRWLEASKFGHEREWSSSLRVYEASLRRNESLPFPQRLLIAPSAICT